MSTGLHIENNPISAETLIELRMTIRDVLTASCGDSVKQAALGLLAAAAQPGPISVSNVNIEMAPIADTAMGCDPVRDIAAPKAMGDLAGKPLGGELLGGVAQVCSCGCGARTWPKAEKAVKAKAKKRRAR